MNCTRTTSTYMASDNTDFHPYYQLCWENLIVESMKYIPLLTEFMYARMKFVVIDLFIYILLKCYNILG
eukprot:UN21201